MHINGVIKPRMTVVMAIGAMCLLQIWTVSALAETQNPSPQNLPGTYHAEYPVLFSETGDIETVEKFLWIQATAEPELFEYQQCWRLQGGSGEWNHEIGGLVISSELHQPVEFFIAEVVDPPLEGSTGFFSGRMLSLGKLDMVYNGLDRGIVFNVKELIQKASVSLANEGQG